MISRLNIQSTIEAGNAAKRPIRTLVVEDSPVAMRAMTGVLRFLPAIEIVGRDGTSRVVRIGPSSGIQTALAAATVDGQACVFEIPFGTHLLVMSHLAVPPGTP